MISKLKPYLILLAVLFVAYLPLSTFHFGMKNDAFSENFPNKYFLSEAIHASASPLWNPYMNYGYPIYADYGFAFWNPITWLFASIGYSAYTLTLEVLLYIFVAGVSMYQLIIYFRLSKIVALSIACCYMCSGFFIGHLQHINFLTGAAFLPFALKYFFKLFNYPIFKNSFAFAVSLYFIAVCGHPDIPIGAVYFFFILFILLSFLCKNEKKVRIKTAAYFFVSAVLLCCLLAPLIYSYSDMLTEYKTYAIENPGAAMNGFFTIPSLISFLFPFSTIAHSSFFINDLSSRNIYISLAGILFFFYGFKIKNKIIPSLAFAGLFMIFLSIGGSFKDFFSKLPLLNFVRTNAEYRVFSILAFCCISGFGMQYFIDQKQKYFPVLKKKAGIFLLINLIGIIALTIFKHDNVKSFFQHIAAENSVVDKTKYFFSAINFTEALLINLMVIAFLCFFCLIKKEYSSKFLFAFIVCDLIINTILYVPVTGIGQVTLTKIQSFYTHNPRGIPVPPVIAQNKIDTFEYVSTGLVGSAYYYNKKIGQTQQTVYPSYFQSTKKYFAGSAKDSVSQMPFVFLKSNLDKKIFDSNIFIENFSPTKINLKISTETNDTLVLLQNNFKFWSAKVNGENRKITTSYFTFLSVPLEKGINKIEFIYEDKSLKWFFLFSILTFIVCFFICLRPRILK